MKLQYRTWKYFCWRFTLKRIFRNEQFEKSLQERIFRIKLEQAFYIILKRVNNVIAYTLITVLEIPRSFFWTMLMQTKLSQFYMQLSLRKQNQIQYIVSRDLMQEYQLKRNILENNYQHYVNEERLEKQKFENEEVIMKLRGEIDYERRQILELTEEEAFLKLKYQRSIYEKEKLLNNLENKSYQNFVKLIPVQKTEQSQLMKICETSLLKRDPNFGFGQKIRNDDFLRRLQFTGHIFESIFQSLPSLVLQYYNNSKKEDGWSQVFDLVNFFSTIIQVVLVCYQMGYLVFMEQLDPIFDFKQMVKKYQKFRSKISNLDPKNNYEWIIGEKTEEVIVKDQRDFEVIERIYNNEVLQKQILKTVLIISNQSEENVQMKEQKSDQLINSFFNDKYSKYIKRTEGFRFDFNNTPLKGNKILQVQKYMDQNDYLKELEFNLEGCELERFSIFDMINEKSRRSLEILKLGLSNNKILGSIAQSNFKLPNLKNFSLSIR